MLLYDIILDRRWTNCPHSCNMEWEATSEFGYSATHHAIPSGWLMVSQKLCLQRNGWPSHLLFIFLLLLSNSRSKKMHDVSSETSIWTSDGLLEMPSEFSWFHLMLHLNLFLALPFTELRKREKRRRGKERKRKCVCCRGEQKREWLNRKLHQI